MCIWTGRISWHLTRRRGIFMDLCVHGLRPLSFSRPGASQPCMSNAHGVRGSRASTSLLRSPPRKISFTSAALVRLPRLPQAARFRFLTIRISEPNPSAIISLTNNLYDTDGITDLRRYENEVIFRLQSPLARIPYMGTECESVPAPPRPPRPRLEERSAICCLHLIHRSNEKKQTQVRLEITTWANLDAVGPTGLSVPLTAIVTGSQSRSPAP